MRFQHFVFSALMTGLFAAPAVAVPVEPHACEPFRQACTAAGFKYRNTVPGNRVIKDCMEPLLLGHQVKSKITGNVVVVPQGADTKACSARIHHGAPTSGKHAKNPPR